MSRSLRAVAIALATAAAGCGGSSSGGTPSAGSSPSSSANAVTGTINIADAASLTEAFTTLGKQFEAAHPGVKVVFDFGPSLALAEQINQGAPAHGHVSATKTTM